LGSGCIESLPPILQNQAMHIITRKRLNESAEKHSTATSGLAHWYRALKRNNPVNFAELRRLLPHADQVDGFQHRRQQGSLGRRDSL
jgi:hypothetical protein